MRDFIKKMQNEFSGLVVIENVEFDLKDELNSTNPVSYTHLTLPTSDLV